MGPLKTFVTECGAALCSQYLVGRDREFGVQGQIQLHCEIESAVVYMSPVSNHFDWPVNIFAEWIFFVYNYHIGFIIFYLK